MKRSSFLLTHEYSAVLSLASPSRLVPSPRPLLRSSTRAMK